MIDIKLMDIYRMILAPVVLREFSDDKPNCMDVLFKGYLFDCPFELLDRIVLSFTYSYDFPCCIVLDLA